MVCHVDLLPVLFAAITLEVWSLVPKTRGIVLGKWAMQQYTHRERRDIWVNQHCSRGALQRRTVLCTFHNWLIWLRDVTSIFLRLFSACIRSRS